MAGECLDVWKTNLVLVKEFKIDLLFSSLQHQELLVETSELPCEIEDFLFSFPTFPCIDRVSRQHVTLKCLLLAKVHSRSHDHKLDGGSCVSFFILFFLLGCPLGYLKSRPRPLLGSLHPIPVCLGDFVLPRALCRDWQGSEIASGGTDASYGGSFWTWNVTYCLI